MTTKSTNEPKTKTNNEDINVNVDAILDELDDVTARAGGHAGATERNANEGYATLTQTTRPTKDDAGNVTGHKTVFTLKCGHLADERLLRKLNYELADDEVAARKAGINYFTRVTKSGSLEPVRRETADEQRVNIYEQLINKNVLEQLNVRYEH